MADEKIPVPSDLLQWLNDSVVAPSGLDPAPDRGVVTSLKGIIFAFTIENMNMLKVFTVHPIGNLRPSPYGKFAHQRVKDLGIGDLLKPIRFLYQYDKPKRMLTLYESPDESGALPASAEIKIRVRMVGNMRTHKFVCPACKQASNFMWTPITKFKFTCRECDRLLSHRNVVYPLTVLKRVAA